MKLSALFRLASASAALALTAAPLWAAGPGALSSAEVIGQVPLLGSLDRAPVSFVRPAQPGESVLPSLPQAQESREFWRTVTAAQLQAGVEFTTTAPGAVVRLSPMADGGEPPVLDPALLDLTTPGGETLAAGQAFATVATADQLRESGVPFPEGTTAFRLRPEAGRGRFRLTAPALGVPADTPYLLHVLDAGSSVTLLLRTLSATVTYGQPVVAQGWMANAGEFLATSLARAAVSSPDGRTWPAQVAAKPDGSVEVRFELDAPPATAPGLWEVHLRAQADVDGVTVTRNVHAAFAFAAATARFAGAPLVTSRRGAVRVTFPLETVAAGRYACRGLVYGRDAAGERRPMAWVETAAWMGPGLGSLDVKLSPAVVKGAGLKPPFDVDSVSLLDQSRLADLGGE